MSARTGKIHVIGMLVLILGAVSGLPSIAAELPGYANLTGFAIPGPQWTDLFDATGKVKDLTPFSGHSAGFIEDNISAGIATDMSKLISDDYSDNGTVQPINDIGNAYAYRTTDTEGNLVVFAGVESLGVAEGSSFIDFEFNQDKIQVWSGIPWKIHGQRSVGDLTVRVNLVAGALHSVELKYYSGDEANGFQILESAWPLDDQSCNGSNGLYAFCSGSTVAGLAATNADVWNLWGVPVTVPAADRFTAVGVNVGRLLGLNPDFSGFTVRTPEDIAFGTDLLLRRD